MTSQEEALKQIKEKFQGKWKTLNKGEKVEDFFREMGMNIVFRKIALQLHPECDITVEGSEVKMAYKIFFKSDCMVYKYGGESEFTTSNGAFKGKLTYADGKLTTINTPADGNAEAKTLETCREINEAGEMVATIKIGEVTATRYFAKQPTGDE